MNMLPRRSSVKKWLKNTKRDGMGSFAQFYKLKTTRGLVGVKTFDCEQRRTETFKFQQYLFELDLAPEPFETFSTKLNIKESIQIGRGHNELYGYLTECVETVESSFVWNNGYSLLLNRLAEYGLGWEDDRTANIGFKSGEPIVIDTDPRYFYANENSHEYLQAQEILDEIMEAQYGQARQSNKNNQRKGRCIRRGGFRTYIRNLWNYPKKHPEGCLFLYAGKDPFDNWYPCLSQIKSGRYEPNIPYKIGEELLAEVLQDPTVPSRPEDINLNNLGVFAAYHRKLDEKLGRVWPDEDLIEEKPMTNTTDTEVPVSVTSNDIGKYCRVFFDDSGAMDGIVVSVDSSGDRFEFYSFSSDEITDSNCAPCIFLGNRVKASMFKQSLSVAHTPSYIMNKTELRSVIAVALRREKKKLLAAVQTEKDELPELRKFDDEDLGPLPKEIDQVLKLSRKACKKSSVSLDLHRGAFGLHQDHSRYNRDSVYFPAPPAYLKKAKVIDKEVSKFNKNLSQKLSELSKKEHRITNLQVKDLVDLVVYHQVLSENKLDKLEDSISSAIQELIK